MNTRAFNALKYFTEKGDLDNHHLAFVSDFNGKAYCGIEDNLFCGNWMLYYEPINDARIGLRVNSDLTDTVRAADLVTYSAELKSKVYLWELNPPSEKCLNCKEYLKKNN